MEEKKIVEAIESGNLSDVFDEGIKDINQAPETQEALAASIGEDIQQYLAGQWGENKVVVVVEKDGANITWGKYYMPIAKFYRTVTEGNGKVIPSLFKKYAEKKIAEE